MDKELHELAFITEEIRREDGPHDYRNDPRTMFAYPGERTIWSEIDENPPIPDRLFVQGLNQGRGEHGGARGVLGNLGISLFAQKGTIFADSQYQQVVTFNKVPGENKSGALTVNFKAGGQTPILKVVGNYEDKKVNFINNLFSKGAVSHGVRLERESFNEGATKKSDIICVALLFLHHARFRCFLVTPMFRGWFLRRGPTIRS